MNEDARERLLEFLDEDCCDCEDCCEDCCEEYLDTSGDFDSDDERETERWVCIGPECINPHYLHTRDECMTVESVEAYYAEREAKGP